MKRHTFTLSTLLMLFLSVSIVTAQGSCSALLETALDALDENCNELDRNNACYGYRLVGATFADGVDADNASFSVAGDRIEVPLLETITTAALDSANDLWGVAAMSLQADIPNTLPGQAVTFVLMGDVEVENAVEPDDELAVADPIEVEVAVTSANIRAIPSLNSNVIGGALNGILLQADGRDNSGDWVRVVIPDEVATGWIATAVLVGNDGIMDLPVLSDIQTPMKSFYLRTGVGQSNCEEAPDDTLLIQTPEDVAVELTINGANIRVGSTILVKILPPGNLMEVLVIDGTVITEDGTVIYENYRSTICLSEPDNRGVDGNANDRIANCGGWSPPQYVNPITVGEEWCILESISATPLNYLVDLTCDEQEITFVQNLLNPPEPPQGTCETFNILSPAEGVQIKNEATFSWTPVDGAQEYAVHFYNFEGNHADSFFVDGAETSVNVNLGRIATGARFQWEVAVLENGVPVCDTGRSTFIEAQNDPNTITSNPTAPSGVSVTWMCLGAGSNAVSINWGATTDTSMSLNWTTEYTSFSPTIDSTTLSISPSPGSTTSNLKIGGKDFVGATYTLSPSGQTGSLPSLLGCGCDTGPSLGTC